MAEESEVSQLSQVKERIRYFNKQYLNPFTLKFAGRQHSPYAIVEHIGRSSGKHYTTPVLARPNGDYFVIPLPYGIHVDWCQNILAAGQSKLTWDSKTYQIGEPEIIDIEEGIMAFKPWIQNALRRSENQYFLRVKRLSEAPESEIPPMTIAQFQDDKVVVYVTLGILAVLALALLIWVLTRKSCRGCE